MNQEPELLTELHIELGTEFTRGYCDEMKGSPMTDEDEIDMETAIEIKVAALDCIGKMERFIQENYPENPTQVRAEVYQAGHMAYRWAATLWMQRN